MIKRGGSFGFTAKPAEGLEISGKIVREEFKGDEAVEARVLRFVDHSHSATAQHLDYTIVRDGLPNE
jgi:hypothetical protein